MKKIALLLLAFSTYVSTAQLVNNVPETGAVSIGTGTPAAGKQLTVSGNSIFYDGTQTDGVAVFNGQTQMLGVVRMDSLATWSGDAEDVDILIVDPYGNVTRTSRGGLMAALLDPIPSACDSSDVENPQWYSALNRLFSPCPDVKVGIGTATPDFNLDVNGTTFSLKLLIGNELGTDTAMINAYAYNHTRRLIQLGKKIGGLSEEVRFVVNNDGAMELTNVGSQPSITINNGSGHAIVVKDSTGAKLVQLENSGLIRSRQIRVDLGTWADHVFEEHYALQSLKDVKQYIDKNGHLPDVPTAADIRQNGLDLGDMQRIQMQKIEELTLHLIEMDERMDAMQSRINELEAENKTLRQK